MISRVALGSAQIPESEPAEPVVVVVPITGMDSDVYDVTLLLPAELPYEDVEVTSQDSGEVTLTVTRPDGYAGTPGLTVSVLCTEDINLDTGWVDATPYLDAGWTATVAQLRKIASIVYFQFELAAAASIDGQTKDTSLAVLNFGVDPTYAATGQSDGLCFTDGNELMRIYGSNSVFVEGTAGVTGTWVAGASYLWGQVSWVAGS